jgi:hypothetical protein
VGEIKVDGDRLILSGTRQKDGSSIQISLAKDSIKMVAHEFDDCYKRWLVSDMGLSFVPIFVELDDGERYYLMIGEAGFWTRSFQNNEYFPILMNWHQKKQ